VNEAVPQQPPNQRQLADAALGLRAEQDGSCQTRLALSGEHARQRRVRHTHTKHGHRHLGRQEYARARKHWREHLRRRSKTRARERSKKNGRQGTFSAPFGPASSAHALTARAASLQRYREHGFSPIDTLNLATPPRKRARDSSPHAIRNHAATPLRTFIHESRRVGGDAELVDVAEAAKQARPLRSARALFGTEAAAGNAAASSSASSSSSAAPAASPSSSSSASSSSVPSAPAVAVPKRDSAPPSTPPRSSAHALSPAASPAGRSVISSPSRRGAALIRELAAAGEREALRETDLVDDNGAPVAAAAADARATATAAATPPRTPQRSAASAGAGVEAEVGPRTTLGIKDKEVRSPSE
jgi:hypothetical protein